MSSESSVLVIDDSPAVLSSIGSVLSDSYQLMIATSGERALKLLAAQNPLPDLILLDVMMPDMDGYETIIHIKDNPAWHHIPVIFVTGMDDESDEEHGFKLGAVDYIRKPIKPIMLKARVKTHVSLKKAQDELKKRNKSLESDIEIKIKENTLIRDVSMNALSSLAKTRDNETGNHILRTQNYVQILGEQLLQDNIYLDQLSADYLECIVKAAPLHDIGKVGIPDAILLKPDKLTAEEFEIMKEHSALGAGALRDCIDGEDENTALAFINTAIEISQYHHEKWDGSGYPEQLSGENIPISARLMALADVFDALISRRCYKPPFSIEKSSEIIRQGDGSHFDPNIVKAFEKNIERFKEIAEAFSDDDPGEREDVLLANRFY